MNQSAALANDDSRERFSRKRGGGEASSCEYRDGLPARPGERGAVLREEYCDGETVHPLVDDTVRSN